MNKKIVVISIILMMVSLFVNLYNVVFAKYVIKDVLEANIFIDKTPPIIYLDDNIEKQSIHETSNEIIIKSNDIILSSTDNIKIKYNEYYYNPNSNNFENLNSVKFEDGEKICDEGFYKIIAVDTSGNKTEIIIVIDKSEPNVYVEFYKKNN